MKITSADGDSSRTSVMADFLDIGKLKSLMNSYGTMMEWKVKGLYPDMIAELNKMAAAFAEEFNEVSCIKVTDP